MMGEFNAILTREDRIYGNPVQEVEIREFNDFLIEAGMTDVKPGGRNFTCSNGQICSKIDREIINTEWIMTMPPMKVLVMDPGSSDHSPLSITLRGEEIRGHKTFKFFNCLANHPDFLSRIRIGWSGNGHWDHEDTGRNSR